ncbi:LacI family DNA-binding transcriptional regulator [Anaerotalea alkaliphila]|uniref:LacI family transcriptional regulator n=1 Tax=Anaerotalea alkaliphila TaxID=2662126 RepID=A0A7X5HVA1_9FIRM|nr:LacI family DNA-binding transcriptional regulator [Anaerotalea alkaliphila]NDL67298.1 LacI family transcriptional regulator [Anaerotalea alkaliphila]
MFNNGLPFDDRNLVPLTHAHSSPFTIRSNIQEYLADNPEPDFTAIFCNNDVIALEFIRLKSEEGSGLSKDIAVVGFDDTLISKSFEISSVHQPIQEMTKTAFTLLLERMKDNSREPVAIELPPRLIIRKSSL